MKLSEKDKELLGAIKEVQSKYTDDSETSQVIDIDIDTITFDDILPPERKAAALRDYDDINEKFSKLTSLRGVDLAFLFTAVALQCLRQYVLQPYLKEKRMTAKESDKKSGHSAGSSDRRHQFYHPTLEEIITNPVPFDAMYGSSVYGLGLSGNTHRVKTLGHDPIFGWVFGSMNIVTSTITLNDFRSFHVKTGVTANNATRDQITNNADTKLVAKYSKERLFDEGTEGKIAFGYAVMQEARHLKSDVFTKKSLPVPVVGAFSPQLADGLASYGIDFAGVATEVAGAFLINTITAMVHRLFLDESLDDKKLFEVRTRKILLYSNCIATASNIVVTAITKNPKLFDTGGTLVTIGRVFSDIGFITSVKKEFIDGELADRFAEINSETERLYREVFS